MALVLVPLSNQIFLFTQYANHFVIFSSAASIYLGRYGTKGHPSLVKWTAITTQIALPAQIMVTIVYWAALHKHVLKGREDFPEGFKKEILF